MSEYLQGWNCWQTLIDITRHCQIILDITIYHLCLTLLDNARYSYYQIMQNIFQIYYQILLDIYICCQTRYCQIFLGIARYSCYQIMLYITRYCQIFLYITRLDIARYYQILLDTCAHPSGQPSPDTMTQQQEARRRIWRIWRGCSIFSLVKSSMK